MCVTKVCYSIVLNGELEGYFSAKRGIQQGDPISPFLFALAMEVLSRMMIQMQEQPLFSYHPKCQKVKLSHMCFADDLMVFCRGDVDVVCMVTNTLNQFEDVSR